MSNSRTVFKYIDPLENKPYKVIYDKNRKLVVTIVPIKDSKIKKGMVLQK